jgi:hypothetical protein
MKSIDVDDVVDKMSDEEFKDFMYNLLRITRVQMERDKLPSLLIDKVQNENR